MGHRQCSATAPSPPIHGQSREKWQVYVRRVHSCRLYYRGEYSVASAFEKWGSPPKPAERIPLIAILHKPDQQQIRSTLQGRVDIMFWRILKMRAGNSMNDNFGNPIKRRILVLAAIVLATSSAGLDASVIVDDSDFSSDIYELRYYPRSQTLFENGAGTSLSQQSFINQYFMQNSGNTVNPTWVPGDIPGYLMASGKFGGFGGGANSTWNTSAFSTMGWDFSSVSKEIVRVELISRSPIFQFAQWINSALGDTIYGSVATPTTFGSGPFTEIYSHTGDGGSASALITEGIIDLTPLLSTSWLSNPNLLELKFGYDLANTDIPARHLQLFRDDTGTYGDPQGFMLRLTTASSSADVPEPSSFAIFAVLGVCVWGARKRRS